MLQNVTKIIGMDMGNGGSASRLGKVKEIRRKTLQWAKEGDSARGKSEKEQKDRLKRKAKAENYEREKIEQERPRQKELEQDRIKKERAIEQRVGRNHRLERPNFDEGRFEEERRARKGKRIEVKRWLEKQKSFEENTSRGLGRDFTKEAEHPKRGKNRKTTVEIENPQGKTLIEYERGKSKTEVRVGMSSRPDSQPSDHPEPINVPRSTRNDPSRLGTRQSREGALYDEDPLDGKPEVYRSRGVSNLVRFYESQSDETKSKNEQVRRPTTKSPLQKKNPQQQEAGKTGDNGSEKQPAPQRGS